MHLRASSSFWILLGLVTLAAWFVLRGPGAGERTAREAPVDGHQGSAMPCAFPLGWSVARLDPGFALQPEEAERAVEEAAALWHEATGRVLFPQDERGDLEIHFVFDERQVQGMREARGLEEMDRTDRWIDSRREVLERTAERLDRDVARHNETIADWSRRGGAPENVVAELQRTEAELEARSRDLGRQVEQLNREVVHRNRRADELEPAPERPPVQTGRYSELVRTRGERVLSASERTIEVFRYVSWDELVLVLAHELGHAMGLDHVPASAAVMSELHTGPVERLQPHDLAELELACPGATAE